MYIVLSLLLTTPCIQECTEQTILSLQLMNCLHTGLHQKRAYTCLGISCTQCIHHFDCLVFMHICISIVLWCTHWVPRHSTCKPKISGVRIECCVHHRIIEMHICMRRKQSKWCTHWVQEIPKQVYALSWLLCECKSRHQHSSGGKHCASMTMPSASPEQNSEKQNFYTTWDFSSRVDNNRLMFSFNFQPQDT